MKRLMSVIISLMLVISLSTTAVYADSWKKPKGNGNSKQYERLLDELKVQLKEHHQNQKQREKLLKEMAKLKKKYKDFSISIFVNGEEVKNELPPVIKDGKMLIPIGPIVKALKAKAEWDAENHKLTITKGDTVIVIYTEENKITVNGEEVKLDDRIVENKNGVFVPISFIIKVLRHKVDKGDDGNTIIIEDEETVTANDNTTGTGLGQFEYVGTWSYGSQPGAYLNDNHWSDSANAYYQVRFEGTQIKLYGAKDKSHGIAAISIDGGTETLVDLYAAERSDNTLVYTSPVLTNGQHILKARVTGAKNANSSGSYVTADRVEIVSKMQSENYARNKTAVASSSLKYKEAGKAVDGKTATMWTSESGDPQWIYVDLGAVKSIRRVRLVWGTTYAKAYKVQISSDAANWTDVFTTATGDGGTDDITFNAVNARYVRIYGTQRSSTYGYSLKEMGVYGDSVPVTTGALSGSIANAPASNNLAAEGTLDWTHWGLTDASGFNRKNGVTAQISNYTRIGSQAITWFMNDSVKYSWTGGTPVANATDISGMIMATGSGNGFQFTVPADTTQKTLKVYVGALASKGKFEAALSDKSALPYTGYIESASGMVNGVFTVNFKAASAGQNLTIKFTVDQTNPGTLKSVTLQAAALK